MYIGIHVKFRLLSDFNEKFNFLDRYLRNQASNENPPCGRTVFPDGQRAGRVRRRDTMKLNSRFSEFYHRTQKYACVCVLSYKTP